jgi:hypothetical protein
VIHITREGEPAFNLDFPFCAECTQIKSTEMLAKGRCKPEHLTNLKDKA